MSIRDDDEWLDAEDYMPIHNCMVHPPGGLEMPDSTLKFLLI